MREPQWIKLEDVLGVCLTISTLRQHPGMPESGQSALNNYLQKRGHLSDLSWIDIQEGPKHTPQWTSICKIRDVERATRTGPRKNIARDMAAEAVLVLLREEEDTS